MTTTMAMAMPAHAPAESADDEDGADGAGGGADDADDTDDADGVTHAPSMEHGCRWAMGVENPHATLRALPTPGTGNAWS
jgi:hypothetical protein